MRDERFSHRLQLLLLEQVPLRMDRLDGHFRAYFLHLVSAPNLFFFNWPKDQDSGSGNASGQIQHDWPISSLEDHNGERGPVESAGEEWWKRI